MAKKEIREFVRNLYHLLYVNIKLIVALEIIEYSLNKEFLKKIKSVKSAVKKGEKLEKSFSLISTDEDFLNLIKIGEETGELPLIFKTLYEKYEFEANVRKEVISLTVYPVTVIVTSIIIVFILLKVVVPKFVAVYKDMNQELPKLTRMTIKMSEITDKYSIHIGVILIIIVSSFYIMKKKNVINFDKYIFKLPIFGKINKKIFLLKFSQELYTLTISNVDFVKSLKIVCKTRNNYIKEEINKIISKIEKGNSIEKAFKESEIFDIEYRSYLRIAEKTGNLPYCFEQLKNIYYERVSGNVRLFLKLLEPISIIFIAMIIGVIVLSVMLPIFRLGENL